MVCAFVDDDLWHLSVAEHTVGMLLAPNRKLHRASSRVRENNVALTGPPPRRRGRVARPDDRADR